MHEGADLRATGALSWGEVGSDYPVSSDVLVLFSSDPRNSYWEFTRQPMISIIWGGLYSCSPSCLTPLPGVDCASGPGTHSPGKDPSG